MSDTSTSVLTGRRLGVYHLQALLGAGGMGEVYRAHDTRLGRDVAIKILPQAFTADPDRLARFEREARVLASLNHPNIGAIYGLEDADGVRGLVLELVEGETLADRLRRGPVPVAEALSLARQMAGALEAAHEKGTIHRDLKPANIKVTPDGIVKVLDFGLAKAAAGDGPGPDLTHSPTITVAGTRDGVILGTAAYMSPEQARGKPIDKRTDIWAFACVLYEMLTGRAAFGGETISDTIAAILGREPDWTALPNTAPPAIRRLLQRCLDKDPRRRFHDIADVRIEIEDSVAVPTTPGPIGPSTIRTRLAWQLAMAIAFFGLVAGGLVTWNMTPAPSPPPSSDVRVQRLSVVAPEKTRLASEDAPQVSPDGRSVAFVATDLSGKSLLYVRSLDSLTAQALPGTDGATMPFWSPDSRFVGFFAQGSLKTVEVSGGEPHTLATAPTPRGGTWSHEGLILFAPTPAGALYRISAAAGGEATPALGASPGFRWFPTFLPDGRHYLYLGLAPNRVGQAIYLAAIDSTDTRQLVSSDSTGIYAPPGYLLFRRGTALMAQALDPDTQELTGAPVPVAQNVGVNPITYQSLVSVSQDGMLSYLDTSARSQLVWFDRQGKQVGVAGPPGDHNSLCMSDDGRRVVFDRFDHGAGNIDLWLLDAARRTSTRLTFDAAVDFFPVCSADASETVFASARTGNLNFYRQDTSTPGNEKPLFQSLLPKAPAHLSAERGLLVYSVLDAKTSWDIWVMPVASPAQSSVFTATPSEELHGRLSPDGRWLAYSSDETGAFEIYVQPFPPMGATWQVSRGGGYQAQWRRDGKELFYLSLDKRLMAVEVRAEGPTFVVGPPAVLFTTQVMSLERQAQGSQYASTADGQRFLVNNASEETIRLPISVVLDWRATLK